MIFCYFKKYIYLCIRKRGRCVSSAWLECLPVTQEVTGSSPVRTAGSSIIKKYGTRTFLL